mmetsp:Transcript_13878/g.51811  ORF Transcript_13878/g.51811 Transcript_13878/m.51811 type:complete len:498 (-) Transcript_13878:18-1511(-)
MRPQQLLARLNALRILQRRVQRGRLDAHVRHDDHHHAALVLDAHEAALSGLVVQAQDSFAGVEEVPGVIEGVESHHVRAHHPLQQRLSAAQRPEDLRGRKGNVQEEHDATPPLLEHGDLHVVEHLRQEHQVVVMHPHDPFRVLILLQALALRLLEDLDKILDENLVHPEIAVVEALAQVLRVQSGPGGRSPAAHRRDVRQRRLLRGACQRRACLLRADGRAAPDGAVRVEAVDVVERRPNDLLAESLVVLAPQVLTDEDRAAVHGPQQLADLLLVGQRQLSAVVALVADGAHPAGVDLVADGVLRLADEALSPPRRPLAGRVLVQLDGQVEAHQREVVRDAHLLAQLRRIHNGLLFDGAGQLLLEIGRARRQDHIAEAVEAILHFLQRLVHENRACGHRRGARSARSGQFLPTLEAAALEDAVLVRERHSARHHQWMQRAPHRVLFRSGDQRRRFVHHKAPQSGAAAADVQRLAPLKLRVHADAQLAEAQGLHGAGN